MCKECELKDQMIERQRIIISLLEEVHDKQIQIIEHREREIEQLTGQQAINYNMRIVR